MERHLSPDQAVAQVAARQHGVVSWSQALASGLTRQQIKQRTEEGRWIRLARGVYRVAGAPVTWQQNLIAACLAGPPGATASHLSAAALHGLWRPPTLPHLTVPPGASARLSIARVHRSPLSTPDVTAITGIPSTTASRLVVECSCLLHPHHLAALVDDALCRQLASVHTIEAALARVGSARGRRGSAALREVLDAWSPGIRPGSPAEMRLLRRIREWGFPEPERQIEVFDAEGRFVGRADLGWRAHRVLIEYDSDRYHNPRHWEKDEARASGFEAAGWSVTHAGKPDLQPSSDRLRRRLDQLIGPGSGRPGGLSCTQGSVRPLSAQTWGSEATKWPGGDGRSGGAPLVT